MHVCFFNRSYWPDEAATGQLLTELAEDLVNIYGCQVSVVAGRSNAGAASGDRIAPVWREERNGVSIWRANGTTFARSRFVGRAANYMSYFGCASLASMRIQKPDLVVSLTDPPIIGLVARRTARRAGVPFVFVCEDIFPEVATLIEDFHSGAVNQTLDRINRSLIRDADAVVALGDRMRQRLTDEKGADPRRIRVIHNWADCEAVAPVDRDNEFSREHDLADRFVLMHSGNVGLSQNLDVLVEAASRLDGSRPRLTIAIVGHGAKRAALEADVRQRALTNVRFFDYQPKERLAQSFASADAFLVSLKAGIEGYIVPSKVYGILAAGRPYVAAVDPSCEAATIALEHRCGVCAIPNDPDALAGAIAFLHDNPEQARLMGENARRAAFEFDRRVAVRRYYDLFGELRSVARAA
jgi:glycosyltransferase involved in cell wall biosynthesis